MWREDAVFIVPALIVTAIIVIALVSVTSAVLVKLERRWIHGRQHRRKH